MTKQVDNVWLQNHLKMPVRRGFKRRSPHIKLANGGLISAQASNNHYCTPKRNRGPYSSCEVIPSNLVQDDRYGLEQNEVNGWVSLDIVVELINSNGGLK